MVGHVLDKDAPLAGFEDARQHGLVVVHRLRLDVRVAVAEPVFAVELRVGEGLVQNRTTKSSRSTKTLSNAVEMDLGTDHSATGLLPFATTLTLPPGIGSARPARAGRPSPLSGVSASDHPPPPVQRLAAGRQVLLRRADTL